MRRSWAVAVAGLAVALGIVLLATAAHGPAVKTDRATGGPPPMGWSSWSFLRTHPTAASVEAQAQAMVTSGLAARGYRYVNLDDFWMACDSYGPDVDSYGRWISDPAAFPGGIASVASRVHATARNGTHERDQGPPAHSRHHPSRKRLQLRRHERLAQ